jgi:hypothetical protein
MAGVTPRGLTRWVGEPVGKGCRVQMLTVAGRRTGRPHATRVVPGHVGECRYPVSRYRQADRARNLRSAGELRGRGGTALFATQEVPFAERVTVIACQSSRDGRSSNASVSRRIRSIARSSSSSAWGRPHER